jgi:hypothetical protein
MHPTRPERSFRSPSNRESAYWCYQICHASASYDLSPSCRSFISGFLAKELRGSRDDRRGARPLSHRRRGAAWLSFFLN